MYYKVFKALDKPSSLFGLRGSYLYYCVGGIAVAAVIALLIGMVVKIIGWIIFFALAAAAYFLTLQLQAKFSEKERTKWFCSHRLPSCIRIAPKRLSSYITVKFVQKNS